jgi:thiol-disulfide isomerase/thioredoxin
MIDIEGKEQLEEFIWENKDKVVVIYFGAEWCGPCKKLKDKLKSDETSLTMPNLIVGHLDIDSEENQALCELYQISSIPVQIFVTLKGTQILEKKRIIGYDWTNFTMTYNSMMEENKKLNEQTQ